MQLELNLDGYEQLELGNEYETEEREELDEHFCDAGGHFNMEVAMATMEYREPR